jgi:hypothetical protein
VTIDRSGPGNSDIDSDASPPGSPASGPETDAGDRTDAETDADAETDTGDKTGDGAPDREADREALFDALPYAVFLAAAIALLSPLWRDPAGRMLLDNYQDQVFFEWMLTHAANAVAHLDSPLFTEKINSPYGLNLMANTSVLALALPLAPLTLLAGPHVTFVLITTLALAGTASAWYFVLRKLLNHRAAAVVGGAFCGFAPSMISQATGHPNIAGQYLLPFIILTVLRLGAPGTAAASRPVRHGLILAALVVVQAFINEEMLFLTALALGVFFLAYGAARPREVAARVPAALKSLGVTTVVAGVVLAYPLAHQFFGPQAYHGLPDYILLYSADLASYWSFARRSIAGDAAAVANLGQGPTEENTFFGWPLLILLLAIIVWLRGNPVVRALALTAVTFAVLSLGSVVRMGGVDAGFGGPWRWLDGLPLFDSVVPTRLALVVTPLVGCLLAIAVLRFDDMVARRAGARAGRLMWLQGLAVLLMVLLPLTPTPLPTFERPFVPAFFTTGSFREHVPAGGVVLGVPPGWQSNLHAMQWQTAAQQEFGIYGGYFLAPNPNDPEKTATYGPSYPPTLVLLEQVASTGETVVLSPDQLAQAMGDLRFMKVTTIVMPAHHWRANEVRAVVEQFAGAGVLVDGVWVWNLPRP